MESITGRHSLRGETPLNLEATVGSMGLDSKKKQVAQQYEFGRTRHAVYLENFEPNYVGVRRSFGAEPRARTTWLLTRLLVA
jgi:hypothetical protein